MAPQRAIRANDAVVAKYLREGVQLLHAMEKPCYTTVCADILTRYSVSIPYHTLRNYFLGKTRPYKEAHASQQLLAPAAERALVDWIHFYSDTAHPLNKRTIRKKAQAICSKRPSKNWIHLFLARWPEIRLGKPSGLDPKRAQAFNRPVVSRCLEQLEELIQRFDIPIENIYNMDEKGCQRGGGRKASSQKCFIPRERRPHYKTRSGNLELVTIVECVCADGSSDIKPGFIFQGKEISPEWCNVDPDIFIGTSENGWTDDFLCARWFKTSFVPQVHARNLSEKPVLLIYDGHGSHEGLEIIDHAIENGIILFCLPPHTTHRLQPLDVGVFGVFARAWGDRCDEILDETEEDMPREDFVKEYMEVRKKTFKPTTIKQAFRKSACYPVNYSIFTDEDFAPNVDNDFYATDDNANEDLDIGPTPGEHDVDEDSDDAESDSGDGNDDGDSDNTQPQDQLELEPSQLAAFPRDPFGFLTTSRPTFPSGSEPISSASRTPQLPSSSHLPSATESSEMPPHRESRSHHRIKSLSRTQSQLESLQDRVEQLESESVSMRTHLALAHDDIRHLKQKLNAKENKSRKRPKLNVEARTLTSREGRIAAAEKEAAREAEQQKKQAAQDQRRDEELRRQQIRLTRDPNHAFTGALGTKSKPDLVDIAFALGIREITHPGNDKITKAQVFDLIQQHFDSNPTLRTDARYEGLFTRRRQTRNNENVNPATGVCPESGPSYPSSSSAPPLSNNVSHLNFTPMYHAPPMPGPHFPSMSFNQPYLPAYSYTYPYPSNPYPT